MAVEADREGLLGGASGPHLAPRQVLRAGDLPGGRRLLDAATLAADGEALLLDHLAGDRRREAAVLGPAEVDLAESGPRDQLVAEDHRPGLDQPGAAPRGAVDRLDQLDHAVGRLVALITLVGGAGLGDGRRRPRLAELDERALLALVEPAVIVAARAAPGGLAVGEDLLRMVALGAEPPALDGRRLLRAEVELGDLDLAALGVERVEGRELADRRARRADVLGAGPRRGLLLRTLVALVALVARVALLHPR